MTRTLTKEEFAQQFQRFEDTAWKLEVRDLYNVATEREEFEYWLRTGDLSLEEEHARTSAWHRNIRERTARGNRWKRVRFISEPLSDYIRWEHAATRYNQEAGEDIRWLPRHHPSVDEPPERDFWLFDDAWVCIIHFDEDGAPHRHEAIDSFAEVSRHCRWRDIAWRYAVPHAEYDPETVKRFTI
ncbi:MULTISPECIES: DUF6879 family protein [unclassified Nocardiopsis]|uniref:DUF6879 family protein n=1 Tax=Nocardiopsis TaxID=2013 RepID=UPI00387A8E27